MITFNYISHIVTALLLAYGLDYLILDFNLIEMVLFYLFVTLGSILPYAELPDSFIGRRIRPISDMIYNAFGHRTITHLTIIFFVFDF